MGVGHPKLTGWKAAVACDVVTVVAVATVVSGSVSQLVELRSYSRVLYLGGVCRGFDPRLNHERSTVGFCWGRVVVWSAAPTKYLFDFLVFWFFWFVVLGLCWFLVYSVSGSASESREPSSVSRPTKSPPFSVALSYS